jgi:hypothetical protein
MSAFPLATARPARPGVEARIDPAGLRHAVHRAAGAAFCTDLDALVVSFVRARIAEHFAVPDDVVDALIATQLLSLATRLSAELEHIASL